jgi:hypothetical protein
LLSNLLRTEDSLFLGWFKELTPKLFEAMAGIPTDIVLKQKSYFGFWF